MASRAELSRFLAWPLVVLGLVGFWWGSGDLWILGVLVAVVAVLGFLTSGTIARKWCMGVIVLAGLGIVAADSWPPPVAGSAWEYVAIEVIWACQLLVMGVAGLSLLGPARSVSRDGAR